MKFDLVIGLCVWALASPAYPSQSNSDKPTQASTNTQQKQPDLYGGSIFFSGMEPPYQNRAVSECLYVNTSRGRGGLESGVVSDACLKK